MAPRRERGSVGGGAAAGLLGLDEAARAKQMKANPWCTSMVAFATSSIFTNQAQPAGTGGSSTVEAADVSLGRLRVESSSDNIHARVELLKTMKLSLSKQATDAVKAVALQSAAPPKQPKQQQQQQQQGGEARRAGAKADEDSQDSGCDEAPDNAMQQLVAKAAAGADLYQALSEGRADVFPAALLLKTPRAPAAVKKEAGLTPGASSAASPAVDLDAMLECALQEAEALHPGGIDLRCAGWFEPDGALLGGCSNVALCDSPGSDELDLEAVELPSYLRRLLLNAPPPAELPAQCPVAHGDQVPVYVDPVQAIPAAPQPAVQPDVEMAPVLLDDASGDEETKHGARQQQQQQQPMDVVEDTPPAASDGSRGTGSGARQEDERAAPAQQPSSAPAAPRQPTKSVVPVLAKRRAKSYALVQQADAARDAATVATGAATAAKALSAHRAEPPKARLGVAKVPTLGRTLGPRRAMVMPANERSDDSPDDQIEEDEQEDKRVPAPSVPTSRPLPPRAGRVPVLSSRRAAVPAPSPAPAPASSHRNGGSDGVVDLVSSCDEDDFVVNAAARSTRRQLPPRSISPCSSLDDEPPAAARRGTAARRGGASAWRAPLVVPSLRPPPTGMPPPGKQRCRVAFNPESLLHKLPALSVPSQAPQAAVRAATRLVEESLGDAAHTLPPWPPRHLQGPAVSSDECDDDVELWDAVDAAAASMRAHAPPSMPAPTAKPTAPRPAAVDEEDELDDLDWDAADAAVDAARAQPQQQQHQHQQHRQPQQHQHQHQQPQWAGDPLVPRSALELLQQEQPGLVLGSPGAPTQSPAEEHAMPMVVEDSWDDDVPMFEGQQQPQPQPQPLPRPQPQLHPMALSSLQGQGLPAGPPRTALPKRAAVDAFSDDDVSCVLGSLPSEGASPQRADVIEDDHAAYAEAPTGGGAFRCLSPQPPGAMVVPVPRAAAHAPAHSGLSSQQERSAAAGNSARGMECKDGGGSVCGTEHEGGGGSARGMEYEDGGGGHVQVVEDDSSVDGDGEEDALVVDDDADMAGYSDDDDGDGDGWAAGCQVLSAEGSDGSQQPGGAAAPVPGGGGAPRHAPALAHPGSGRGMKEALRARLIQEVLASHRRSHVDLECIMAYLSTTLGKHVQLMRANRAAHDRLLPAGHLGGGGNAGGGGTAVASLRLLTDAALANRSALFGDQVEVSGHRLFLALLNLAHQHNTAVASGSAPAPPRGGKSGTAAAAAAAAAAAQAASGGQLGRLWLPGRAALRLEQVAVEGDGGGRGDGAAGAGAGAEQGTPPSCWDVLVVQDDDAGA